MDLFPSELSYHTLDCLGVSYINMVEINLSSTSMAFMTNYELHTVNKFKEKLGGDGSKITH